MSTATAYLTEPHAVGRPDAPARRAQLAVAAVNVGGIGIGALVAGILAQWVAHPLTVPYLVFLAALLLGTLGVALSPETREGPKPRPSYRPQRVSVPPDERSRFFAAALSAFMAFATLGLFTGLAGLFLAVTLHHPSHALAGAVLFAIYASAVAAQILTVTWPITREFEAGMAAMVIGLGVAVLAVWLRPPSLGLFIAGGALIGAGGGTIFRGAVGTVMSIAPPDRIAESLAGMFLAGFVGLSLPVVGVGITLSRHVTPKVTILGFAIVVSAGIAASAVRLVGRTATRAGGAATAARRGADAPDGTAGHHLIDNPTNGGPRDLRQNEPGPPRRGRDRRRCHRWCDCRAARTRPHRGRPRPQRRCRRRLGDPDDVRRAAKLVLGYGRLVGMPASQAIEQTKEAS